MLILDQLRKDDRRLLVVALVVLGGLASLLAGLWYVQVVSARRFQASLQTQTYRNVRIPAIRGKILDRNGLVLAENRPCYDLDLYIEELRMQFDSEFTRQRRGRKLTRTERTALRTSVRYAVVSNTVQRVAQTLQSPVTLTPIAFHRHHDQWPYRPLAILEDLTQTQIARFLEQAPSLPGVDLEVQPLRYYPNGEAVSHILGQLRRDDTVRDDDEESFNYSLPSYQGRVGIEYAFEKELSGKAGVKSVLVNSLSYRESETVWTASEPGQNVVLTIDLPIQKAAAAALRGNGPTTRGAVVVLDASNGDILALASSPAYDPNEFVAPISEERYRTALNDPKLRQTFNRATQGAYPLGSVFKIVTALASLEAGVLTPEMLNQPFRNPGYYMVGRRRIDDLAAPGDYDFRRAFAKSSNTYFIFYGLKAGRDRLLNLGHAFHLGEPIGLATGQEVTGTFPRPEDVEGVWVEGNTANLCIGQEIAVTPLQVAVMTAAVANGGEGFLARVVQRVEPVEPGLEEVRARSFPPRLRDEVKLQQRNLEIVRAAMLADVEDNEGTGKKSLVPGMDVCGKTGTAQIKPSKGVVDHILWFASFAPYQSPRYVVVVMIEGAGSGGGTCAPVARQVYLAIQKRLTPARPPAVKLAAIN